jgi:hypothetical protein
VVLLVVVVVEGGSVLGWRWGGPWEGPGHQIAGQRMAGVPEGVGMLGLMVEVVGERGLTVVGVLGRLDHADHTTTFRRLTHHEDHVTEVCAEGVGLDTGTLTLS